MTTTNDKTDNSNADTSCWIWRVIYLLAPQRLAIEFRCLPLAHQFGDAALFAELFVDAGREFAARVLDGGGGGDDRMVCWGGRSRRFIVVEGEREEGQKRKTMFATCSPFLAMFSVHRVALFPPQRGQSARASLAAAHPNDKWRWVPLR